MKNRAPEEFFVEYGYYATASNRRAFIFPLFKLSDDGESILKVINSSDADYDRVLLPVERVDVLDRFLLEIKEDKFKGRLPGRGRSQCSDLFPPIDAPEITDAYAFALGEPAHIEHRCRLRLATLP